MRQARRAAHQPEDRAHQRLLRERREHTGTDVADLLDHRFQLHLKNLILLPPFDSQQFILQNSTEPLFFSL